MSDMLTPSRPSWIAVDIASLDFFSDNSQREIGAFINQQASQKNHLVICCHMAEHAIQLLDIADQNHISAITIELTPFIKEITQPAHQVYVINANEAITSDLAVQCHANRCEIWGDTPGIYTANPDYIPEARLLKQISYEEAKEIASMGLNVFTPQFIIPLENNNIALMIKDIKNLSQEGTLISFEYNNDLLIKRITVNYNVTLISIESLGMWHHAGFLADIFSTFKKNNLSVDCVSTSESNVTVSLDFDNSKDFNNKLDAVIQELQSFSHAEILGPFAAISLIGNNIRTLLPKLGPVFELFEAQKIYLLSQAANDLHLTMVINETQASKLLQRIHHLIIEQHPKRHLLGKSWAATRGQEQIFPEQWWNKKSNELLSLAKNNSPLYVYNLDTIRNTIKKLQHCDAIDQIFYAIKANNNITVLKTIYENNINLECVSLEEVKFILTLFPDIDRKRILFTPNFAAQHEYQEALKLGVYTTIDSLYPLQHWPNLFKDKDILLRIDPGYGAGHHKFVHTGGVESKFGVPLENTQEIISICNKYNISVIGLHIHSGSGILETNIWLKSADILLSLLNKFTAVRILNFGGGLGIVEKPSQHPLNLEQLNTIFSQVKTSRPELTIWIEPGRYLVAESGVLLSKVTQIKSKKEVNFLGIETGMNSLIRPTLYGAYHEIVNLSRLNEPKTQIINVVGPICESGDVLGYSRLLPSSRENDIVLIANTGAYGHTMSSNYNLRNPAEEICI